MIAKAIHDTCAAHQIQCLSAHRFVKKGMEPAGDSIAISTRWDSRFHGWWSRFTMFKGTGSVLRTAYFLKKVKAYAPDVIHLHNLHGSYINLPLLFRYIKRSGVPVVWTLHDCWAFTAICPHFVIAGCDRWQDGCGSCPQKKRYSSALLDVSAAVWRAKKRWFTGMPNATLAAPSHWVASLAQHSFLKEYPVKTIYNGIDLTVFRETDSSFRGDHGLEDKKIVLGVAFDWGYSKGLDVFVDLAGRLKDGYQVVLVGVDDKTGRELPDNILSIRRTQDQRELAALYTAADVFVNPTREETLGLVNLEALACGTPVVTFRTGGSPECVDALCGVVVEKEDVDGMEREIRRICTDAPFRKEDCRRRAEGFDNGQRIEEYIRLYQDVAGRRS